MHCRPMMREHFINSANIIKLSLMQINLLHLYHVIHSMCTKLLSGKDSISTNSVQLGNINNKMSTHLRSLFLINKPLHISSNLLLIPVVKHYRSSRVSINAQVCFLYKQKKMKRTHSFFGEVGCRKKIPKILVNRQRTHEEQKEPPTLWNCM